MRTPHYIPGEWKAVIAGDCVAFLPPETDDETVERLWASMGEGEDLMSQLVIITDGRFSGLPAFAIARIEEAQVHLMVRGNVELKVEQTEGEQHIFAPSVSTWLEQIVDDATRLVFQPAGEIGVGGAVSYPVSEGVVLADQLAVVTAAGVEAPVRARRPVPKPRAVVPAPPPLPEPPRSLLEPVDLAEPAPSLDPVGQAELAPAPEPELQPLGVHAPIPPSPANNSVWLDSEHVEGLDDGLNQSAEDHDGMTVMNSEVVALRQQLPAWAGDAVPGPLVDPADRSVVPKIVLSTGMAVALDRPVLLGRAPQVSRVKNDEMPRLITVESPNHDISRTHAEVRMEGNEIVVTDLNSTNGVLLTRPGAVAERLKPGAATAVEAGAVVDLGEGVTFVVGRQA